MNINECLCVCVCLQVGFVRLEYVIVVTIRGLTCGVHVVALNCGMTAAQELVLRYLPRTTRPSSMSCCSCSSKTSGFSDGPGVMGVVVEAHEAAAVQPRIEEAERDPAACKRMVIQQRVVVPSTRKA